MSNFFFYMQVAMGMVTVVAVYGFWIRPILRSQPSLKDFYAESDSFWGAVRLKFQGIKGRITSVIGMAVSAVIYLHDDLVPYVTQVDWGPLTQKVPGWVWPFAAFAAFYFIDKCRKWADARASRAMKMT